MVEVDPNQVVQSYAQTIMILIVVALIFSSISRIIAYSKLIYQRRKY